MGDVIDFKKALKNPKLSSDKLDVKEFIKFYEENKDFIDDITAELCIRVDTKLDIERIKYYDMLMVREAVMSMVMRGVGLYHPLQEFTDEYGPFLGGTDDYS